MENQNLKTEKSLGEPGYVNKNCWLARNLNYPPAKRCQYCGLRLRNCIFQRYLLVTLILVFLILSGLYLFERNISKSSILSIFVLVIAYGYFFNKSTEKIIESNFAERRAKDAFKELSENLQQKVDDQTKEIKRAYEVERAAKEQLEGLDAVKNNFLMTVQHHLRTPLTSMRGYSDLLLDGSFGKLSPKVKGVVRRLEMSITNLIKMVNDFLDVTQFQLGKEVVSLKDEIDLCHIFQDIFKDIELEAKKKGIYFEIERPEKTCLVKADESKLKAALTNVFDNAVKYTKEGGVSVKLKTEGQKVKVEIKDTGMGIPKDKLSKIFDIAFERTEGAKKSFATGRGVGLYLSSQIIKAHNGKIWAESDGEGKGSVFHIELPIEKIIA